MFAPPGLSPLALIPETGPVTERLRVREIDDDEGRRLVRFDRYALDRLARTARDYL